MKQQTVDLFDQLRSSDWFVHVGGEPLRGVFCPASWQEAAQLCVDSADLFLDISEDYRSCLREIAPRCWQNWNEVAHEIRVIGLPLIDEKMSSLPIDTALKKKIRGCVRWSLLHAAMEIELSDVIPPAFFASLMPWYLRGRFPCGWVGEYPAGQLAVY